MKLEDFGVERQETTLSNGVKLVLYKRMGMPVYIRASFFAGSRFDEIGKEGTAHFLEHMLTAGTRRFPAKDKLATYIEQYGGAFGASTSGDTIGVNVSVSDSRDIGRAAEMLREMLLESLFNERVFKTERNSILKELGGVKSNPDSIIRELWQKLSFQDTVLGRSILGSEQSIKSISKSDILDLYQNRIVSGVKVFVASGGTDLSYLKEEIEGKISSLKSGSVPVFDDLSILRKNSVAVEVYGNTDQVHLLFGFRCVPVSHSDVPVLDILSEAFGRGRASILQRKLRYEKGLVYGVSVWQRTFVDSGSWKVKTSTSKHKVGEVLAIIIDELKRVSEKGLSGDELKFVQDKMAKSKPMEMQTSESWVGFHGFRELFSGSSVWTLSDYVSEIRAVTPEMTRNVAQKYFGRDKWYLAVCGDIKENEIKINW